jgi:hypothetical protein
LTSESTLDYRDLVLHEVEGKIYEMQNITKGAIATAVKNTEPNEQTDYSAVIK